MQLASLKSYAFDMLVRDDPWAIARRMHHSELQKIIVVQKVTFLPIRLPKTTHRTLTSQMQEILKKVEGKHYSPFDFESDAPLGIVKKPLTKKSIYIPKTHPKSTFRNRCNFSNWRVTDSTWMYESVPERLSRGCTTQNCEILKKVQTTQNYPSCYNSTDMRDIEKSWR